MTWPNEKPAATLIAAMDSQSDRIAFARNLRRQQTDAERRLWRRLRSQQLLGCKFRRQHPIGPYFADFACLEIRLVVELDGGQHAEETRVAHDRRRTLFMMQRGFEVLRFWDNDVLRDVDAVMRVIARRIAALTRTSSDLSRKRERYEPSPALSGDLSRKRER